VEGLLIAAELARLRPLLPAQRLPWRFLGERTLVLPIVSEGALWIELHPTRPRVVIGAMPADTGGPSTSFARTLHARAGGPLVDVQQFALDRRFVLRFGASDGFVPVPAIELMVELTGHHANALLLEPTGRIVAVHREVTAARNRHRQLVGGVPYRPPPPYDKLDPREADPGVVASVLRGRPLARAYERIDGVGKTLARAWAHLAGVDPARALTGDELEAASAALPRLVADPAGAVLAASSDEARGPDPESEHARARRRALEDAARRTLAARRSLLERRIADTERALGAADDAARLRAEADLLLAHAHRLPRGEAEVTLEGFDGTPIVLQLDPAQDVAANARRRYDQARKREARAERALAQHERIQAELDEVVAAEAGLADASEEALRALGPDDARPAVRRETRPGLRVVGPHGLEVVIGRSARENDLVTFRVGRSDDVWLHAQGYHGAHVLIRAQGKKEVPFDAVLFAAQLAAGHSDAGGSDNVPVDYTSRKHVWKVKGAPAGAVSYAQQKTVYVTPLRRSQVD
jgi:predicted ribosome quality control (RQC) complex YloA/Tae2 family protein